MQLPNAKELAKLAAACRKAGISTFKGGGIEFTLSDTVPETKAAKKAAAVPENIPDPTNDDLPYEALLHWSLPNISDEKADS